MIILIAIGMILVLISVILCMTRRLTRAREDIYRAEYETSRARIQHMAAREVAKKGERRCQELLSQMRAQVANTGQALNVARQIQVIGEELHEFFDLVTRSPLEASRAKHAITAAPAPVPDETGEPPGAYQAGAYPGWCQDDGYRLNGYHHPTGAQVPSEVIGQGEWDEPQDATSPRGWRRTNGQCVANHLDYGGGPEKGE